MDSATNVLVFTPRGINPPRWEENGIPGHRLARVAKTLLN